MNCYFIVFSVRSICMKIVISSRSLKFITGLEKPDYTKRFLFLCTETSHCRNLDEVEQDISSLLSDLVFLHPICLPRSGTVLASFFLLCCGHPYSTGQSKGAVFGGTFVMGFAQMCLTFFFIPMGWILAVYWGYLFVSYSSKATKEEVKFHNEPHYR